MFALRQNYKDKGNNLVQGLIKIIMNYLHEVQNRNDFNAFYNCISEQWMQTEYDDTVLDNWKLPIGIYVVKYNEDVCLNGGWPSHLGDFILGKSESYDEFFSAEINNFYNDSILYTDRDSLYIEKEFWDVLDKTSLVGDKLGQGKFVYESGDIFYGLFLSPKIKYCSTIDKISIIKEGKRFGQFIDCKRLFNRSQ